jgi:2'-5' RNA ligase
VPPENWHLTLKFLGPTEEALLPQIASLLRPCAARRPPCLVELRGMGAFPHAGRPSVIWVGISGAEILVELAAELDAALAELGFAPERRPFAPHLTLLRVKSRPPEALFDLLRRHTQTHFGAQRIEEVALFESLPVKWGARYHPLAKAHLEG